MSRMLALSVVVASLLALPASRTVAQAPSLPEESKVQLPANPAAWLNSPPLTSEMLAGKAAFLYFFEESCPKCRERWPAILDAAKKFQGKPIVFIAVNSGTPRNEIQQYAREVGLTWPVVVDPDRSFEKAAGLETEISLQNIYQARALLPDGSLQSTTTDIEQAAPRALTDAKWRVEPADIPDALKPAWLQIEFGNFNAAAPLIKKNLTAPKADVKAAAERLMAAVKKEMAAQADDAKQAAGSRKWEAYKKYTSLALRFKSYELPSDIHATLRELAADEAVRNEMAANKLWDSVARQLPPAGPPSKGAASQLQRIVKQHPTTEAAKLAQAALDRTTATAQQ